MTWIWIDLSWSIQIQETCLKANRKLSFLRSVKLLDRKTLDLLYKVTVRSLIDYEINRLEQLQYKAAKAVLRALKYTSREKLNKELWWETIQKWIEYLGLSIFHKIHVRDTRPLLKKCFTKLDWVKRRNLKSKGGYLPYPNYGNKGVVSSYQIGLTLPSVVESDKKINQSQCNLQFSICIHVGGKVLSIKNHHSLFWDILFVSICSCFSWVIARVVKF